MLTSEPFCPALRLQATTLAGPLLLNQVCRAPDAGQHMISESLINLMGCAWNELLACPVVEHKLSSQSHCWAVVAYRA